MSTSYFIVCLDCGEALMMGKILNGQVSSETEIEYCYASVPTIHPEVIHFGHFLVKHCGHSLSYVSNDLLDSYENFSFVYLDCDFELENLLTEEHIRCTEVPRYPEDFSNKIRKKLSRLFDKSTHFS